VYVFGAATVLAESVLPTRSPSIERAVAQFRTFYLGSDDAFAMRDSNEPPPEPARALAQARKLREDGSWADLDYASKARSGWAPDQHCGRMLAMATLAGMHGTTQADRSLLLSSVHRAFAYWISKDFQCTNWWYNQIGVPKGLGALALILGNEINAEEYRYMTQVSLARYPITMTGQNKVWLAGNTLMRGLLLGDEGLVAKATETIWSEVAISTAEGLQPDYSFHQHGPQLQFGNYGMAFAVETARWARILRDTPWALSSGKLEAFRGYLLEGQNWISWRGVMDISSCGRQLMPHSPVSKASTLRRVMTQALVFDPSQAAAYQAFIDRNAEGAPNDLVGTRYFWRSDYLVHRRPGFMASLKMSSNRVIGAELVNSENLSGYHLADGALYLYRTGEEYADIFPVWDWSRLPGVTCLQAPVPPYKTSQVLREFVGGLSDGQGAVAALDYERDGVSARKAWFFAGDSVLCLGAGLSSKASGPVATTINQCLLRGPVQTVSAQGKRSPLATGTHELKDVHVLEHDGWTYTVFDGAGLRLQAGPVSGNWHRVFNNPESPAKDLSKELFTLWYDHGMSPKQSAYAYMVAPIGCACAFGEYHNEPRLQSARASDGRFAAVLWEAGECVLPDGRTLKVNHPCLILVSKEGIRLSDPTQKLKTLGVVIGARFLELSLPAGPLAGTGVLLAE